MSPFELLDLDTALRAAGLPIAGVSDGTPPTISWEGTPTAEQLAQAERIVAGHAPDPLHELRRAKFAQLESWYQVQCAAGVRVGILTGDGNVQQATLASTDEDRNSFNQQVGAVLLLDDKPIIYDVWGTPYTLSLDGFRAVMRQYTTAIKQRVANYVAYKQRIAGAKSREELEGIQLS